MKKLSTFQYRKERGGFDSPLICRQMKYCIHISLLLEIRIQIMEKKLFQGAKKHPTWNSQV